MSHIDRREFILKASKLSFGIGLLAFTPFLSSCEQDENPLVSDKIVSIDLNSYEILNNVGSSVYVFLEENPNPLIVLRKSVDEFVIFDSTCTHQGCSVMLPEPGSDFMECPCHGARYALDTPEVLRNPDDGTNISYLTRFTNEFEVETNSLKVNFSNKI